MTFIRYILFAFLFTLVGNACRVLKSDHPKPHLDIAHAPAPLFRDPVFDGAADPAVVWDELEARWLIFYTQRRANLSEINGVDWCYGTDIGICESRDSGKSWHYVGVAQGIRKKEDDTFWAPCIVSDDQGIWHMFVTYISGIYPDWGGVREMSHYVSDGLIQWSPTSLEGLKTGIIDPVVVRLDDGTWKLWFKNEGRSPAVTYAATSIDLIRWEMDEDPELPTKGSHEGQQVFRWKGNWWMVIDPCTMHYTGLEIYQSDDATHWIKNNTILNRPGMRLDDNDQGRHAWIEIVDDRAFIFYFTHPGAVYDANNNQINDGEFNARRSSLQLAELLLDEDARMICNRDTHAYHRPIRKSVTH